MTEDENCDDDDGDMISDDDDMGEVGVACLKGILFFFLMLLL